MILPVDAINIDLSEVGDDVGLKYKYIINSAGYDYELSITANFQVVSHTFSETDRSLKFNLETPRETENKLEVQIPNEVFTDEIMVLLNGQEVFPIINLTDNIVYIFMTIDTKGEHVLEIIETKSIDTESQNVSNGGGCLIATATFGSEMAPQVQLLREIRDNSVLQTESGKLFMSVFNQFYYSFSPTVSDYEMKNPIFKESIKLLLIPLITSLTLLEFVEVDSEFDMLVYGIGIISLNIVMYFIGPIVIVSKLIKSRTLQKVSQIFKL